MMTKTLRNGFALSVLLASLAACGQSAGTMTNTTQCVDIPDTQLFTVIDGNFTPVAGSVASAETAMETPAQLASRIGATLPAMGLGWASLSANGTEITVTGVAPDAETRRTAFRAARSAIQKDAVGKDLITNVRNGITVAPAAATTAPAAAGSAALVGQLTQGFADDGYPWLGLDVKGQVGTLTGVAPDAAAKDAAFAAGSAAIKNNPEANAMIGIIVDGISVQGGEAAIGAALADLPENPNLDQCQNAFIRTLDGRNVSFETGKAIINRVSSTLLDATTGVALLCSDYNIEIGGHTDSRGSDAYNLDLSQRRASAVRAYLIERGVSGETLSAVGYGETRPIDPAQTAAAYAINRRTEFIVRPR